MNNYELSRLIVDDIMKKVNAGEQVFYMEYVRSVETLLNKHAAQQSVQLTASGDYANDTCLNIIKSVNKLVCPNSAATNANR